MCCAMIGTTSGGTFVLGGRPLLFWGCLSVAVVELLLLVEEELLCISSSACAAVLTVLMSRSLLALIVDCIVKLEIINEAELSCSAGS